MYIHGVSPLDTGTRTGRVKCKLGQKKKKDVKSNMKMNTKIIEVRIKDSKLCCYTKMIIQSCVLKNNPSVVAV